LVPFSKIAGRHIDFIGTPETGYLTALSASVLYRVDGTVINEYASVTGMRTDWGK
jgi:hypothetical protein